MKNSLILGLVALSLVVVLGACSKDAPSATPTPKTSTTEAKPAKDSITIWWFQWAPADGLAELGKDFEKETGIAVNVEQIPQPHRLAERGW